VHSIRIIVSRDLKRVLLSIMCHKVVGRLGQDNRNRRGTAFRRISLRKTKPTTIIIPDPFLDFLEIFLGSILHLGIVVGLVVPLVCARLVTDRRTPLNILGGWGRWNLKITNYGKMGYSFADSIGNTEG
jgi:hypothetical protein